MPPVRAPDSASPGGAAAARSSGPCRRGLRRPNLVLLGDEGEAWTMHAYRLAVPCLTGCALLAACAGPGTGTPTRAAVASIAPASVAPASVDWKAVAYPAAGCMSRSEWLALGVGAQDWDAAQVHVQTAELT